MPFTFEAPEYNFYLRKSADEVEAIKTVYEQAVREGWTRSETIRTVRRLGLGYRTKEMLEDINRAYAIEQSKTEDAYNRANTFFNTVKEAKARGGYRTYREALDFVKRWQEESFKTEEEAELANELEETGIVPS